MNPYLQGALIGLVTLACEYFCWHVGYSVGFRDGTIQELLNLTMPMS